MAAGILLVSVFGPATVLGGVTGGALTDSVLGVILAQTFVAAPFTVIVARGAFATIDEPVFDVAATMGLGQWRCLRAVAVPAARRAIAAGLVLTWLRAFGEFGATVVVAYHPASLPVYTFTRFEGFGLHDALAPTVVALAVAGTLAALAAVVAGHHRRPRSSHASETALTASVACPPRARAPRMSPPSTMTFDVGWRVGSLAVRAAYAGSARLAVMGPTGAGKTTLLRSLAGLTSVDAAHMALDGDPCGAPLPARARRVGYVPQDAALVPGRRVGDQVRMGGADEATCAHWLGRLGLAGLEDRVPHELSGGQRRLVAWARALATGPRLLLLDEPFGSLDVPVAASLRRALRELQGHEAIATVVVTHDPDDAAALAGDLLVLAGGEVRQAGPTGAVFARPASPEVAALLRVENVGRGVVVADGVLSCGGRLISAVEARRFQPGTPVLWRVAPEAVSLEATAGAPASRNGAHGLVRARVTDVLPRPGGRDVVLDLGGTSVVARRSDGPTPRLGSWLMASIPAEHVGVWVDASEPTPAGPEPSVTPSASDAGLTRPRRSARLLEPVGRQA
jgi:molybdate transport system permease protein